MFRVSRGFAPSGWLQHTQKGPYSRPRTPYQTRGRTLIQQTSPAQVKGIRVELLELQTAWPPTSSFTYLPRKLYQTGAVQRYD